jgi:hypothetical protein
MLAFAGLAACAGTPSGSPEWVRTMIARFEAAPVANPPHRIVRYRYRDQIVFYVPPSCCDQPGQLYDDHGNVLCAPDGGMTGRGDGQCADFHALRSEETLVWRDSRER